MGEAENIAWRVKDRDEQILPVAVPEDEAFMKQNYLVMFLLYVNPAIIRDGTSNPSQPLGYYCDTRFHSELQW